MTKPLGKGLFKELTSGVGFGTEQLNVKRLVQFDRAGAQTHLAGKRDELHFNLRRVVSAERLERLKRREGERKNQCRGRGASKGLSIAAHCSHSFLLC